MDESPEIPEALSKAQRLRRYLIAGLLVWLPVLVTVFVLQFLIALVDQTLLFLPENARPEALLGFRIPGLGLLLAVVVLLATGLAATNLVGRELLRWWENLMKRIPLVRSLYSGTKTFTETVFSGKGQAFQRVLLVEYPRKGIWTLAFQTAQRMQEPSHRAGCDLVGVFVPTTPNPTSGFIIMVPREDLITLEMSVEDAMRVILTLGVVAPAWQPHLPAGAPQP